MKEYFVLKDQLGVWDVTKMPKEKRKRLKEMYGRNLIHVQKVPRQAKRDVGGSPTGEKA